LYSPDQTSGFFIIEGIRFLQSGSIHVFRAGEINKIHPMTWSPDEAVCHKNYGYFA